MNKILLLVLHHCKLRPHQLYKVFLVRQDYYLLGHRLVLYHKGLLHFLYWHW